MPTVREPINNNDLIANICTLYGYVSSQVNLIDFVIKNSDPTGLSGIKQYESIYIELHLYHSQISYLYDYVKTNVCHAAENQIVDTCYIYDKVREIREGFFKFKEDKLDPLTKF